MRDYEEVSGGLVRVLGELDDVVRRHNGGAERAEGGERAEGVDGLSSVLEQRNEASNGGQKDVVT